ncbi:MAG: hypothetical protein VB017_02500 [Endomicrobiaceae bacterium]|nr:hypothetical protein [Endomicrobiaceae bacterium]
MKTETNNNKRNNIFKLKKCFIKPIVSCKFESNTALRDEEFITSPKRMK